MPDTLLASLTANKLQNVFINLQVCAWTEILMYDYFVTVGVQLIEPSGNKIQANTLPLMGIV